MLHLELLSAFEEQLALYAGQSHRQQVRWVVGTYLVPNIGHLEAQALTPGHLQRCLDMAAGRGLAAASLRDVRGVLSAYARFLRLYGYCAISAEDLRAPRGAARSRRSAYALQEVAEIWRCAPLPCKLMLAVGLRPGEALGLKWADLEAGALRVRRAVNVRGEVTAGKTAAAQRCVPLPEGLQQQLRQHRREQQRTVGITPWVFDEGRGEPVREPQLYRRWRRWCRAHGVRDGTLYELRHTYVTMVQAYVPLPVLQRQLGHVAAMDTYAVYAHDNGTDWGELAAGADRLQLALESMATAQQLSLGEGLFDAAKSGLFTP